MRQRYLRLKRIGVLCCLHSTHFLFLRHDIVDLCFDLSHHLLPHLLSNEGLSSLLIELATRSAAKLHRVHAHLILNLRRVQIARNFRFRPAENLVLEGLSFLEIDIRIFGFFVRLERVLSVKLTIVSFLGVVCGLLGDVFLPRSFVRACRSSRETGSLESHRPRIFLLR